MKKSIKSLVKQVVYGHVETRGAAWLLGLGYTECFEYGQAVCILVHAHTGVLVPNNETAIRYIREIKNELKAAQAA